MFTGKPNIKKVNDEYARETGEFWCCGVPTFTAAGESPGKAYNNFIDFCSKVGRTRPELAQYR